MLGAYPRGFQGWLKHCVVILSTDELWSDVKKLDFNSQSGETVIYAMNDPNWFDLTAKSSIVRFLFIEIRFLSIICSSGQIAQFWK